MRTSENFEPIRRSSKQGRGAATAANKGKQKRKLKPERHLSDKKYMKPSKKRSKVKQKKVPKRIINLLDGIPS